MIARVVGTHVWPDGADVPVAVDPLVLDWGGPVGDRHYGLTMRSNSRQSKVYPRGTEIRNHRQVSIVDVAELAVISEKLGIPTIPPGMIADNICTDGIEALTALPPMTRLVFDGGAVLMLGGANNPCAIAGEMVTRVYGGKPTSFPKAATGLRGVTGWVERPGEVGPGTKCEVKLP